MTPSDLWHTASIHHNSGKEHIMFICVTNVTLWDKAGLTLVSHYQSRTHICLVLLKWAYKRYRPQYCYVWHFEQCSSTEHFIQQHIICFSTLKKIRYQLFSISVFFSSSHFPMVLCDAMNTDKPRWVWTNVVNVVNVPHYSQRADLVTRGHI
jgi:hypothetical protein